MTPNDLSGTVVDAAVKVHSRLGPGLLESVYVAALMVELLARGLRVEKEVAIPVVYEGVELGLGFRADLIVEGTIIVEVKAVEQHAKVHVRQLHTYLKLSGLKLGLLLNFGAALMKDGIVRVVNELAE